MPVLPLAPPLAPMLARLARELPAGDVVYEPKWDGFRCLAFVEAGGGGPAQPARAAVRAVLPGDRRALAALPRPAVLDGEIVVPRGDGLAFEPLLARLHPSPSRVTRLARETPAALVLFDLLAEGEEDLRPRRSRSGARASRRSSPAPPRRSARRPRRATPRSRAAGSTGPRAAASTASSRSGATSRTRPAGAAG